MYVVKKFRFLLNAVLWCGKADFCFGCLVRCYFTSKVGEEFHSLRRACSLPVISFSPVRVHVVVGDERGLHSSTGVVYVPACLLYTSNGLLSGGFFPRLNPTLLNTRVNVLVPDGKWIIFFTIGRSFFNSGHNVLISIKVLSNIS